MKKLCTYLFVTGCIIHTTFELHAQAGDTLTPVKVFSKKPLDISSAPVNVQQLNKNSLSRLNSRSVADAVKYFSGVVMKDYGGIGGLKTISVRSLGANHTGVMYDGIMINDAQGGQIDLGRFSLDNIETIQLFNSQPTDLLLPARTYASASVLALSSSTANNTASTKTAGIKMKIGSFGFINPSVYYRAEVNKNFVTGINAEYQSANGNYPFIDYETGHSEKKRTNSDIKTIHLEYDAVYMANDSNQVKLKAFYYNSKQGLPGSVFFYYNFSNQRLNNENFFSQLSWQKNISPKSRILISSKYSTDYKYYVDPSYQNSVGKLENEFHQNEFYVSAAYSYRIFPSLSASYAVDYFKNKLKRTDVFAQDFANPERDNLLNNIAVQWKEKGVEINGNLLHTYLTEKVEHGPAANDIHKLTPAFSASVQPAKNFPLRLRLFYKNIFRVPTFDDLYYTNLGNTKLRPEYAKQYNVGITISLQPEKMIRTIIFTSDAYYNRIKDKIVTQPRQNTFQWTTINIGTAAIKGIDVAAHLNFKTWHGLDMAANFSYTYQRALDISDPSSYLYKTQLPYTPEHFGSVNLNINYLKFTFSYNILSSSYRYQLGVPGPENIIQGWATHDASIGYRIASKKYFEYKLLAEANNLYNLQYQIVKYYPMPRFNYRLGVIVDFKK